MIFREITALNDWTFGRGINGYLRDQNAVDANIKTRLQSWKGDCFFSLNDFVDWLGRLDKGQENNLNQELKNVIIQSFGVTGITSFSGSLNRITRFYELTFNVTTIFSPSYTISLNLAAGFPTGS